MAQPKRIFLVAGEISGDTHGAALMKQLERMSQGQVTFAGLGGPLMREVGGEHVEDWVGEAGVVGLWEVLKKYGWFRRIFDQTKQRIASWQPDAVILIDYPGFNLRLAKALRKTHSQSSGPRLIYYISPQVWAWNRRRIPKMAKMLDLMLCIFPFEKQLYEDSGLRTEFVGHPFGDEIEALRIVSGRDPTVIGLFPGSREREVAKLFPVMRDAAIELSDRFPSLRFEVAAANEKRAAQVRCLIEEAPVSTISVTLGDTYGLMQRAGAGVVASGTASLEAAFFGLPYCLVYKVAPPTYLAARAVMRVPYLGMVNILAGKELVHEFLQNNCSPAPIAGEIARLVQAPDDAKLLSRELMETVSSLTQPGTHTRAAQAIWDVLEGE